MKRLFLNPLSCKQYTELASHRLDRQLSFLERIVYRFHHLICLMCRRFNRQIGLIEKAAQTGLGDCSGELGHTLSAEARHRIAAHLRQTQGK